MTPSGQNLGEGACKEEAKGIAWRREGRGLRTELLSRKLLTHKAVSCWAALLKKNQREERRKQKSKMTLKRV